jgi:hypothetical protein
MTILPSANLEFCRDGEQLFDHDVAEAVQLGVPIFPLRAEANEPGCRQTPSTAIEKEEAPIGCG